MAKELGLPEPKVAPAKAPKPRKTVNVAELIKQRKLEKDLAEKTAGTPEQAMPSAPIVHFSNSYFEQEKKHEDVTKATLDMSVEQQKKEEKREKTI